MMILVSIVQITRVAVAALRKAIAIAPQNRWSRHITSRNKQRAKFAQTVVALPSVSVITIFCAVVSLIVRQTTAHLSDVITVAHNKLYASFCESIFIRIFCNAVLRYRRA